MPVSASVLSGCGCILLRGCASAQLRGLVLSDPAFSRDDSCLGAVPSANLPCLVLGGHFGFCLKFIVALKLCKIGI